MSYRKTKLAVAISGSLALAACGGGGSGSITIPTPGDSTSAKTFSFNFSRATAMFTQEIRDLSPEARKEIEDAVTVFQFIDSHSLDAAKSQGVKVEFNGTSYEIDYVWNVLKGITNQYYVGKEDFWKSAAAKGQYDDESTAYQNIQYYDVMLTKEFGDASPNQLDEKIADYFHDIGKDPTKAIADVVTDPVIEEPVVEEPVVTEPVVAEPVVEEPVVTEPVVAEPVVEEPVVTEPVVEEPVVIDPVVVNPEPLLEIVNAVLSSEETMTVSASDPVVSEVTNDDTVVTTDSNGNTVTELWKIYYTTTTIHLTTTITTTTYKNVTYSDGSTGREVVSTDVKTTESDKVMTDSQRVLVSRTVTANVKSTEAVDVTTQSVARGDGVLTTTSVEETAEYLDSDGNTVTEVWTVYTDTTTVPVTTTTTVTTTTYTTWTDGTVTSEVTNVASTDAVTYEATDATRRDLKSSTTTPNVKSTSTSQTSEDTVTRGDAVVTTTSVEDTRVSTDANGSTVTDVYTVYTDTTTVPVTTTTVVTDYRTTVYTDGTSVTEPVDVNTTVVTVDEVTVTNREELVSHTVTANVVGTEDNQTESVTTTVSEPTLTETIVNTDTREDGVWTFFYDIWVTTTTVTTTVTTTRTTTWTDGTTTNEVIDVTTTEDVTAVETVKQRVQAPEAEVADPEAPESEAGSTTVTQDGAPTLDYDPDTYDASTYYNSSYMGTPTPVDSHDPVDHATTEADNNANLDVNANYAWARGWTGKGSTVMIMDTGIDTDHSEFEGKIKYQFDPGYADGIEDTKSGHGTHVAGIVAAADDGVGMKGVAYDADLAVARTGERNASPFYARQALEWAKQYDDIVAANFSANYNYPRTYRDTMEDMGNGIFVSHDPVYGGHYYNMEDPTKWGDALNGSEIVVTVSAGNQSIEYVQSPATMATATDADGNLLLDGRMLVVGNWNKTSNTVDGAEAGHICMDYANGTCNDAYVTSDFYILAPGIQVNSAYNDGGYKNMSGTSMASPVVAGAVAIVHQLWPYMKGKNIAQLLLQTADKNLPNYSEVTHGQGLLDLDRATRPVGDLGISLTGRTGATMPVSGSLSANIDTGALASVSAVDDFDRDFTLNLTPATGAKAVPLTQSINAAQDGWGASTANLSTKQIGDFRFGSSENGADLTLGYTDKISKNLDLTLSYTKTDTNPWVDATGMWGETQGSQTVDASVKYKFSKETYANLGMMNTTTEFKPGLVTNISDVQAVYAGAGYNNKGLNLYAGIKPYAIGGKLDLRIPTGVAEDGTMQYAESSSNIKSKLQGYASVNYTNKLDDSTSTRYSAGVDSTGDHSVGIQFTHQFW